MIVQAESFLLGGFIRIENHARQIGSFPQNRDRNKTSLKPPPRKSYMGYGIKHMVRIGIRLDTVSLKDTPGNGHLVFKAILLEFSGGFKMLFLSTDLCKPSRCIGHFLSWGSTPSSCGG